MKILFPLVMFFSTGLAAAGQIFFRLGAKGQERLLDFVNPLVLFGIGCYILSTILWIWALSRAPLIYVYPFTMLTFALVYLSSAVVLGEYLSLRAAVGLGIMMVGLTVMASTARPPV